MAPHLAAFPLHALAGLLPPDGHRRVTLSGRKLITTVAGERQEEELSTDADVLAAYRSHFGIVLDWVPVVRAPSPE